MIVGFNHNISYKAVGFHVQTEDSGVKSPHLVTLLYHAGTIIASQKTVYADILKVDNLSQVVEELAKEQHKGMLRKLTQGHFDERISALGIVLGGSVAAPLETVVPETDSSASLDEVLPAPTPAILSPPEPVEAEIVEVPIVDRFHPSQAKARQEASLDDLIYAYLSGADHC